MKNSGFVLLCSALMTAATIGAQPSETVWQADCGDGTYVNPILHADYSDPDVCRVGDDYYMTASSFNCVPALPILHSEDLVNWTIMNYAVERLVPEEVFDKPQHAKGVWAPCIRYHNGMFYIYWGDPDYGIYMVKTTDPAEKWDSPVLVKAGKGMIDPSPLWDDDGRVYLAHAWAGSRGGMNSIITMFEMNAEGTAPVSGETMIFDGNAGGHHTVEGPKFYKRGKYYYLFAPAGGVTGGWQLVMRSENLYGPYEAKTVMAQGTTDINGPHQGGWVETQTGESWFLHFQDKGAYGRITHLNPMSWSEDGWPVIGVDNDGDGCGEPVRRYRKPDVGKAITEHFVHQDSDEFDGYELGKQWSWHANPKDGYGFASGYGYYRMYSSYRPAEYKNFMDVPNLLLQKFVAEEFEATAKLSLSAKSDGEEAGLIIMGYAYARIGLVRNGEAVDIVYADCLDARGGDGDNVKVLGSIRLPEAARYATPKVEIYLRTVVREGAVCEFRYSTDGKRYETAAEGFTAQAGGWIGAKIGIYCINARSSGDRGWADVNYFRLRQVGGR